MPDMEGAVTQEAQAPAQDAPQADAAQPQEQAPQAAPESPAQGQAQEEAAPQASILEQGEEAAEGAPESYSTFTDADGNEYAADSLGDFTTAAKEMGLSQEKAQKLFTTFVPTAKGYLAKQLQGYTKEWAKATMADPELGGPAFRERQGVASAAYRQFATPELRQLFNSAGLGNHPEVVRLFYRIGKGMQQDTGVAGSASSPAEPRRRYPKSNMVPDSY